MDSETEVIRHQMEGTRTALAEKLEMLEEKVTERVQEATTTVADTVESVSETVEDVKETVEETVDAMKHTFDLQWHADHHPWALMGGAVVLGFVGGRLLVGPPHRSRERDRNKALALPPPAPLPPPAAPPPPAAREKPEEPSSGWLGFLGREIGGLKKLGIGMAMSVLREVAAKALPAQISSPLSEAVNSLTEKLGGQPLGLSQPGHAPTTESAAPREQHACEMMP
jgi:ElaB/YqjD/DUF883 family membrane-anchored ribosome-binding protein